SPESLSPSLSALAPCTPATSLLSSSLSHFLLPPLLPSPPRIPPVLPSLLLSPLLLPSPPPALSTLPPPLPLLSGSLSPLPVHLLSQGTRSPHPAHIFLGLLSGISSPLLPRCTGLPHISLPSRRSSSNILGSIPLLLPISLPPLPLALAPS